MSSMLHLLGTHAIQFIHGHSRTEHPLSLPLVQESLNVINGNIHSRFAGGVEGWNEVKANEEKDARESKLTEHIVAPLISQEQSSANPDEGYQYIQMMITYRISCAK